MTTKGEYRVGISFNPSADPNVDAIKAQAAGLIDLINALPSQDGEQGRLKALAMSAIEEGAMWAVKAATKQPVPDYLAGPAQMGGSVGGAPSLNNVTDPFIEAVRSGVIAVMGSIGPWAHPKRLGPSEFLHILGHLQRHGFSGAAETDIINVIEALRRTGGVK